MDYLQYHVNSQRLAISNLGFKPYYKWITFNTNHYTHNSTHSIFSFKPYYKWITFNTNLRIFIEIGRKKSFKPYYKWITFNTIAMMSEPT